jgi:hypothetical protein
MIVTDVVPAKHHRASRGGGRPEQEAVMNQAVPAQHPAVVLRSHYTLLRALLATAMIAIVGLTATVVVLATDDEHSPALSSAAPVTAPDPSGARYDGGPEEGTRGTIASSPTATQSPSIRYDGGPEEGSAVLTQGSGTTTPDSTARTSPPDARYDGGPEEGSRGSGR